MKMNVAGDNILRGGLIIFLISILMGCEDQRDCVTDHTSHVLLNFFVTENGGKAQKVRVGFDSVYTRGVDSLFYAAGDTVETMTLPVNPFKSSVTYYFDSPNFRDSLTLNYKRKARLISPICGTEQVYQNLTVGETTFDSVAVRNKKLEFNVNNISIYF